ncbi:MAG: OmpH family outer membrane protein [Nitrospirae bacterium]|nr:OmpH family outer membrane protein [Nitrospirota bacterium]
MRIGVAAVIAFMCVAFSSPVFAEMKFASVDMQRALNESDEGKAAKKQLDDYVSAKQSAIVEVEEKIKELQEQLGKQKHLFTADGIKAKEEEIEKLIRDYKRLVGDAQDEVQKQEQKIVKGIMERLSVVVREIGKRDAYTVVFEQSASRLLYVDTSIDITPQVVELFNKKK